MLGLLGISAESIVSLALKGLSSWVIAGAGDLINALGSVLSATTEPPLGSAFDAELGLIVRLSATLVPLFLVGAVIHAVLRQELSLLVRAVALRAPVALLGSGIAIEMVLLAIRATDALSRGAIALAGASASGFVNGLSATLVSPAAPLAATGFEAVLLALLLSAVALALWLELAVRGAAIVVALLFVPLALAGVVFPATAHWARRLGETLFALIFSKLAIACVLALGASSIGDPQGASGFVEGVALLLLAALSPFALLRLLPMIEGGAVGHLEGLGRRALMGTRVAFAMVPSFGDASSLEGDVGSSASPGLSMLSGMSLGGSEFEAEVEQVRRELFAGPRPPELDAGEGAEGGLDG